MFLTLIMASFFGSGSGSQLTTVHQAIEKDYQSVAHISASQFSELSPHDIVVFDVRQPEEFDVSHIDGAIQVTPGIDASEFIEDYGDLLDGKQVIFYCSVGRRSSELASKLNHLDKNYGAQSSQNLIGGIFSWVNQGRELSDTAQEVTNKVHPYNERWGRLVEDQSKLSYFPN